MKNRLLVAIAALLFASLACQAVQPISQPSASMPTIAPPPTARPVVVSSETLNHQEALTTLYESVSPGIVSIQVLTAQGGSLGSGFVYDDQGHIITNFHVIEGQTKIEVDFTSGYKAYGKLVGTDLDSDLA